MKKILLLFVFVFCLRAEDDLFNLKKPPLLVDEVLTREEINNRTVDSSGFVEYYPVNDLLTERTVFVHPTSANHAFISSLNYYNRNLLKALQEATEKARDEDVVYFVNIVGGYGDNPAHTFGNRNNVYKVDKSANGSMTVFMVDPSGDIQKDHYSFGEYGQLGRDGVSFYQSILMFKSNKIRDAVKRAEATDESYDWQVVITRPDQFPEIKKFDKYLEYEMWVNREQLSDEWYTVEKIKSVNSQLVQKVN